MCALRTHVNRTHRIIAMCKAHLNLVRLPYSFSKEFRLLGFNNEWAEDMDDRKSIIRLSFKRVILLSL